ncbi:MAG: DUF4124 domain-containing protein [Azoarcus sp.]|jgi:hypothetical protein|nr:DUF4124 domain-containing protein [Azoarcus sp.]
MKLPVRLALVLTMSAISALALIALPASAEIYKWKDKDGKTHFSDMPPNGADIKVTPTSRRAKSTKPAITDFVPEPEEEDAAPEGDAAKAPESAEGAKGEKDAKDAKPKTLAERDKDFKERRAAEAEARAKAEKESSKAAYRAQECERAKNQHAALTSGIRIARPSSNGREYLNDAERAAEIERVKGLVDTFCNGK